MIPVKRVEIVVVAPLAGRVTTIFARHGLKGWTMVPNVRGQGEHGIQRGDDLTGVACGAVSWSDAVSFCEANETGGATDWRELMRKAR